MHWLLTHKGDAECRALADRHYSRQSPGASMFCRPGYNMVLKTCGPVGIAAWVWFRPKWESGIKGTERKDGLHAIECTLFRNESGILSSMLVLEACQALLTWEHALDVEWPDGAITGINVEATAGGRSKYHSPGRCYLAAGWVVHPTHRKSDRANFWVWLPRERFRILQADPPILPIPPIPPIQEL